MMRNEVIKCLALVEALIDFGEGEDIEEGIYDQGASLSSYVANLLKRLCSC